MRSAGVHGGESSQLFGKSVSFPKHVSNGIDYIVYSLCHLRFSAWPHFSSQSFLRSLRQCLGQNIFISRCDLYALSHYTVHQGVNAEPSTSVWNSVNELRSHVWCEFGQIHKPFIYSLWYTQAAAEELHHRRLCRGNPEEGARFLCVCVFMLSLTHDFTVISATLHSDCNILHHRSVGTSPGLLTERMNQAPKLKMTYWQWKFFLGINKHCMQQMQNVDREDHPLPSGLMGIVVVYTLHSFTWAFTVHVV